MLKSVKAIYLSVKCVIEYHNNFSRSIYVLNGVNNMINNIKPDTDLDLFFIDNLLLFALMYADDAVIFPNLKLAYRICLIN